MKIFADRARLGLTAVAVSVFTIAGCSHVKDQLLQPQVPGLVDPTAVGNPTAALALRNGAIGRYKQVQSGESIWQYAGTLADEYKNADFSVDRINADQRLTDAAVSWNYGPVTQSRGFIRDAIGAMIKFNPDSAALIGELYMELAFFEMTMADNYCNGIPLGHMENGVQVNGAPITVLQVYDSAANHLDTALVYTAKAIAAAKTTADQAGATFIDRAARVWKARVLIDKDRSNAGAAAALVATVPTTFAYDMTFSASAGSNGMWSLNNSTARIGVADSFDIINGQVTTIKNALPFVWRRTRAFR